MSGTFRGLLSACAVIAAMAGCAQIPVAHLQEYREAFTHAREASEKVLLDYDQAIKEARAFPGVEKKPDDDPAQPYPVTWEKASADQDGARKPSDIDARRLGFKIIGDYNAVLAQLAEGKSVEEVRSASRAFVGSVDKFLQTAGATLPGVGALTSGLATLMEAFERARLREQFVQAAERGAPVVQQLLDAFIADIKAHYDMRAALLNRERLRTVRRMNIAAARIQDIVRQHNVPAAELKLVQEDVGARLSVVRDLKPVQLGPAGASDYAAVARAGLGAQQRELERLAQVYEANLKAMAALASMLNQYHALLRKTQSALRAMVKALYEPQDLAQASDDMLALAFSLKRDLEDFQAARRNP